MIIFNRLFNRKKQEILHTDNTIYMYKMVNNVIWSHEVFTEREVKIPTHIKHT